MSKLRRARQSASPALGRRGPAPDPTPADPADARERARRYFLENNPLLLVELPGVDEYLTARSQAALVRARLSMVGRGLYAATGRHIDIENNIRRHVAELRKG